MGVFFYLVFWPVLLQRRPHVPAGHETGQMNWSVSPKSNFLLVAPLRGVVEDCHEFLREFCCCFVWRRSPLHQGRRLNHRDGARLSSYFTVAPSCAFFGFCPCVVCCVFGARACVEGRYCAHGLLRWILFSPEAHLLARHAVQSCMYVPSSCSSVCSRRRLLDYSGHGMGNSHVVSTLARMMPCALFHITSFGEYQYLPALHVEASVSPPLVLLFSFFIFHFS